MVLQDEMILLKNKLKEMGLNPKDMLFYEFRNLSIEHEKKFQKAKEEARKRIEELADMFPHAFGKYGKRETTLQDLLWSAGINHRGVIS